MKIRNLLLPALCCIAIASCQKAIQPEILQPIDTTQTDTTGTDTIITGACTGEAMLKWHAFFDKLGARPDSKMFTADTVGNVYIATYVTATDDIDADPGAAVLPVSGSNGVLVVKLDTGKNVVWSKKIDFSIISGLDNFGSFNINKMQVDDNQNISVYFSTTHRLSGITIYHYMLNAAGDITAQNSYIGTEPVLIDVNRNGIIYNRVYDRVGSIISMSNSTTTRIVPGLVGSMAFSPAGDLYVAGKGYKTDSNKDYDGRTGVQHIALPDSVADSYLFIAKYSATGDFIWVKYISEYFGLRPPFNTLHIDNAGNAYITDIENGPGVEMVKKFSPGGDLIWQRNINIFSKKIWFDSDNNFYGVTAGSESLTKFNPAGDVIWSLPNDGSELAFADQKNIYTSTGFNIWKYSICH